MPTRPSLPPCCVSSCCTFHGAHTPTLTCFSTSAVLSSRLREYLQLYALLLLSSTRHQLFACRTKALTVVLLLHTFSWCVCGWWLAVWHCESSGRYGSMCSSSLSIDCVIGYDFGSFAPPCRLCTELASLLRCLGHLLGWWHHVLVAACGLMS